MTARRRRTEVVFVMDAMTHYREEFYLQLREGLEREEVAVRVVHGVAPSADFVSGQLPWAEVVPLRKAGCFTWMPVMERTRGADLVIAAQVVRQLHLYGLMQRQRADRGLRCGGTAKCSGAGVFRSGW